MDDPQIPVAETGGHEITGQTSAYPPSGHFLRWLRLTADTRGPVDVAGSMPVLGDYFDHTGGVRLGPLAAFTDLVAGILSVRNAAPDWVATNDLQIHLTGSATQGMLRSITRPTRVGRSNIVSDTEVFDETGQLVALAIITYSRLSRQEGGPALAPPSELRELAEPAPLEAPRQNMDALLGFAIDAAAGTISFDHRPLLRNSTGAIQGGVIATAMEWLAADMASLASGQPCHSTFLQVHYLAQGRKPPFEVRGRIAARAGQETLIRVEAFEVETSRVLARGLVRSSVTSAAPGPRA